MAVRGERIRIRKTVLEAEERSERIPEETRRTPMVMWVKGSLIDENGAVGDMVTVETDTGRRVAGELLDEAPSWNHGFGIQVPELDVLARRMRRLARELRR
ncbi:MAG: 2-amino-4-oxopentanoate thiolase subunit OrtA [Spirochaetaceae bacterium]|nr:2-amino-4-oxopentanoate thiolase subunit OrtA [Spirochaetaceae bacterium]MDT8299504.1 2-amino-4-oxopentanoate thiolase subunit OrtA [Spirochaetaceae bacterium]